MKKLDEIISEMFEEKRQNPPAFAVENILAAARAKGAKSSFGARFKKFALSSRGVLAAAAMAVVLSAGVIHFEGPVFAPKPSAEEVYAMYTNFNGDMDNLEDDVYAVLYDL